MASKKGYELTQEGIDNLKEELRILKDIKRPENVEALKEARAQGDLTENADYDAARNEQARIESRITEIDAILKDAKIIKQTADDIVNIGKNVTLKFVVRGDVTTLKLVGTIEANPKQGKISIESPLGRAIKNCQKGDLVQVKSETGKTFEVEILDID